MVTLQYYTLYCKLADIAVTDETECFFGAPDTEYLGRSYKLNLGLSVCLFASDWKIWSELNLEI